ncbi:MAG: hypothetical protein M1281_07575 [Chloroflexi bacterium]|nr:hypothetical protein [Chloroflexota bacterium]
MIDFRKFTLESLLYILAFLIALSLRLLFLGSTPLNDAEATLALQSLGISRFGSPILGPFPGYEVITGAIFFMMGSSTFLARFLPAVAGSALVFAPWLFDRWLGRGPALLLAFALALDPGMVSISRQVGSPVLGLSFTLLALGAWMRHRPAAAGVLAGLALLGGPQLWPGILGIGITLLLIRRLGGGLPGVDEDMAEKGTIPDTLPEHPYRLASYYLLGSLLIAGTLFFTVPRGISAFASSLATYLQGWGILAGAPVLRLPAALLALQPLALFLGIWGAIRGFRDGDRVDRALFVWFAVALLLAIAYPSRQVEDLAWAILPLWALAARELHRHLIGEEAFSTATWLFTGVSLAFIIFVGLNFTGILATWQTGVSTLDFRLGAAAAGLVLLVLIAVLVSWGWSSSVAGNGLFNAGVLALMVYLVSSATSTANLRLVAPAHLWSNGPAIAQEQLLLETIGNLSEWKTGAPNAVEVVVDSIQSPALRWALRNMPNATFVNNLGLGSSKPPIVITPKEEEPALSASYRGESFVWEQSPDWSQLSIISQLEWLAYRQAPVTSTSLILWARTDLFLGSNATIGTGATP